MLNPWEKLRSDPPFILSQDNHSIAPIITKAGVNDKSIPEPFIGNPYAASVVLLNLSPGDDANDPEAHRRPDLKEAIMLNLHHKPQDYPFYPLDPAFESTAVGRWWWRHLHELFDKGKVDPRKVAQQLCVIEWFPYHSKNGRKLPQQPCCESQGYSFELARKALENHTLVIGLRGKPRWAQVDPAFANVTYVKNWQNPTISPGNVDNFDEIVEALRSK
jgi:hypothetical protein